MRKQTVRLSARPARRQPPPDVDLKHAALFERAIARGEIPKRADVKAVSRLLPKLAAYRSIGERKTFTKAFYVQMIDLVVLPALRAT